MKGNGEVTKPTEFLDWLETTSRSLSAISKPEMPMARARRLVEDHISAFGYVPHPDKLKDAIATDLAFVQLAATPYTRDIPAGPTNEDCAVAAMLVSNPQGTLRKDGDGWQKRVNDVIRALMAERNALRAAISQEERGT